MVRARAVSSPLETVLADMFEASRELPAGPCAELDLAGRGHVGARAWPEIHAPASNSLKSNIE